MTKKKEKTGKVKKIVVNIGVGRMSQQAGFNDKILPEVIKELSEITGQKPVVCQAKKSIAGFKTRAGQVVGLKVTLRRRRMEDFLKRLINMVFPRLRDFRGISLKNVDQNGNLNIGLKEQYVFSEISQDNSKIDFGMEISIVSDVKDREKAIEFFRSLGVPLERSQASSQN
jgi:large subunit ribosomal protein L5